MRRKNFFVTLFLLFTLIPLVELYILVQLTHLLNLWWTFAIVIITGIIGASMAKKEIRHVFHEFKETVSMGQVPGQEMLNGLCVFAGAIFLVTPGLLTDITGFTLLLPITRQLYVRFIKEKASRYINPY